MSSAFTQTLEFYFKTGNGRFLQRQFKIILLNTSWVSPKGQGRVYTLPALYRDYLHSVLVPETGCPD
jgi:hypothetical protein